MIEAFLKAKIGLNVESIGRSKLDADIRKRMAECGVKSMAAYESYLLSSEKELDALVALVTVPETWFFRAYDSFIFLEEFVKTDWMASIMKDFRKLRVLSVPCSTGEEPYSIAMTFLRCGLPPEAFSVDAADINLSNIVAAKRGVYTKNSFRSELQWFKDLYFKPDGKHFILDPRVKSCVSFRNWNILDLPASPSSEQLYDVIFCRNLLIYFDEASQKRALDLLSYNLREGGLLFLGHAEAACISFGRAYLSVQAKGSFAFKKVKPDQAPVPWDPTDTQRLIKMLPSNRASQPKPAPKPQPAPRIAPRPASGVVLKAVPAIRIPPRTPPPPAACPFSQEPSSDLQQARALADKGLLKEAVELCKKHIAVNKLDPDGYFLLGVALLSLKRTQEAESCINKALFLKPDHSEALLRMAAIKEGRGDLKGAELCRLRAGRT